MRSLDNKGFTLIEVLAVVVIIGITGLIAVPSVLSIINAGKSSSYDILVKDITVASIQLHEEVSFVGSSIYQYNNEGFRGDIISINNEEICTNLQTLVSNGFLNGINNPDKEEENKNLKIVTNPLNGKDIGSCEIKIKKIVEANTFKTSYKIENNSDDNEICPTSDEYEKALSIK